MYIYITHHKGTNHHFEEQNIHIDQKNACVANTLLQKYLEI